MAKKEDILRQRNVNAKVGKVEPKLDVQKEAQIKNRNRSRDDINRLTTYGVHRAWIRSVVVSCLITLIYFCSRFRNRDVQFALVKENLNLRVQQFPCSESYQKELAFFPKCKPQTCGRFVTDKLIDPLEASVLFDLADKVMSVPGLVGGASIFDLQTGALAYGKKFINAYNSSSFNQSITTQHMQVYKLVMGKIEQAIADQYGISTSDIHLARPTYFSRLTNETLNTVHDVYWRTHVDKLSYESFYYTSILYLSNYNTDFTGGRFIFVDGYENNRSFSLIEPKKARLLAFTSGSENTHFVEEMANGIRYALTIAFTCDIKQKIPTPTFPTNITKDENKNKAN